MTLLLLLACADTPTWHGEVKPLTDGACARCHSDAGIAPFALSTRDDYLLLEQAVRESVSSRSMPPFLAEPGHTPLAYDTSLTDAQIATILAWYDAGAPEGDPDAPGEPVVFELGGLDNWDLELSLSEPFEPTVFPDQYRCFVMDWPEAEVVYITGTEVMPGNPQIAHHAAVYVVDSDGADAVADWDAADSEQGYGCYGSLVPEGSPYEDARVALEHASYVAGWTPGVGGYGFEDGVRVEPGSKVVVQLHYFADGPGVSDQTTLRFATADQVPAQAYFLSWVDPDWMMADTMQIPQGQRTTLSFRDALSRSLFASYMYPQLDLSGGVLLETSLLHMHTLGQEMTLTLHPLQGPSQVLVHIPRYDFAWQQEFVYAEPVFVGPWDELELSCTWDNTHGEDISWGDGTQDEMCVVQARFRLPD